MAPIRTSKKKMDGLYSLNKIKSVIENNIIEKKKKMERLQIKNQNYKNYYKNDQLVTPVSEYPTSYEKKEMLENEYGSLFGKKGMAEKIKQIFENDSFLNDDNKDTSLFENRMNNKDTSLSENRMDSISNFINNKESQVCSINNYLSHVNTNLKEEMEGNEFDDLLTYPTPMNNYYYESSNSSSCNEEDYEIDEIRSCAFTSSSHKSETFIEDDHDENIFNYSYSPPLFTFLKDFDFYHHCFDFSDELEENPLDYNNMISIPEKPEKPIGKFGKLMTEYGF